jgi:hypothetical protein
MLRLILEIHRRVKIRSQNILLVARSSRQLQPSLSRDSRSYSSYLVISIVVIRRLITPGASAG